MREWIKCWLLGGVITSTALCLPAQQQQKNEPGPQAADQAAPPPAVKESVPLDPERQKKVDTWIQELGNSSFRIRKKASRALWDLMDEALPALEEAAGGEDPEVTISAQELIDKIKAGIAPGMSDEIIDQIDRFRTTRNSETKFRIAARIFELENGERVVLNLLRNESNEYTRRGIIRTIAEKLYTKIG
ncbi:MAG: hypothetical protein VCG02_03285, partial [Verrucomicrobiota bacterium]